MGTTMFWGAPPVLSWFDPFYNERNASTKKASPYDGCEQFDQLHLPEWSRGLHHLSKPSLKKDDGESHGCTNDEPPRENL